MHTRIIGRLASGYYHPVDKYADNIDIIEKHIAYYNGEDVYKNVSRVNLEWVTDTSLLVDYYYTINYDDNAAYRVRFNYVKPDGQDEWQLIPIR